MSGRKEGAEAFEGCIELLRGLGMEMDESSVYARSQEHQVPLQLQLACYDGQVYRRICI